MEIAIVIVAILVVALATVLVTQGRRRATTGALSRETRRRDLAASPAAAAPGQAVEDGSDARSRAAEAREAAEAGVPAAAGAATPAEWVPVDEEELGVTRRQFFNRGILASVLFATATLGAGVLAFLWPSGSGGFGGKITAGRLSDILATIRDKKAPFYVPEARSYIVPYPKDALGRAEGKYADALMPGLEEGVIALFQRCPHLGCRVPWCQSSQWFECPCHGSKYNRVGEKRDGPAPRGMDAWPVEISGDTVLINTASPIQGQPIGVDTTEQKPEGPSCI